MLFWLIKINKYDQVYLVNRRFDSQSYYHYQDKIYLNKKKKLYEYTKLKFLFKFNTHLCVCMRRIVNIYVATNSLESLTARKYKIGLINFLLNRIWIICTTQEHRNEVKRLEIILLKNEYPENIINQTIDKYILRI